MSSFEDRQSAPVAGTLNSTYEQAIAEIEAKELKREAAGYAVMASFAGFDKARSGGLFGRIVSGAKWFCIWFGMILPVFLFWQVAF